MRMVRYSVLMLMVTTVLPVAAQRADSAATARRLVREASEQLTQGDTAAALERVVAATRAWPVQGAYQVMAARLAAATGRTSLARDLLARLNAAGYAWNTAVAAYDGLRGDSGFRELASGSEANQAPMVQSEVFRTLPDERLHPEAVAFDARSGRVFVTSVRQRKVVVLEPDGRIRDFVDRAALPLDAVLGVAVDTIRDRLWLATSPMAEEEGERVGPAAIVAVELRDGVPQGRWTVPNDGNEHVLGEVSLAADGRVYATDSRTAAIYRVPEGRDSGVLEDSGLHHRDWMSLQGLAFDPGGAVAWVADWTTGLFRIDLATGTVTPVESAGDGYLLGIDDLLAVGPRRLVAIQNGIAPARIALLELDGSGTTVARVTTIDRHLPLAEEPTGGTLVAGALLYVANSPWGHYQADGSPDPANPFPQPVLLRLPLRP